MGHESFASVRFLHLIDTAFTRARRHATIVPQLQSYDRDRYRSGNSYVGRVSRVKTTSRAFGKEH
jgi:hypothetical protein